MKISLGGVPLVVVVSFVINLHLISAFVPPIPRKPPSQGRLADAAIGESSNDFTGSPIYQSMVELGYEERQRQAVSSELERADLSSLPWTVWRAMFLDFLERPEVISQQLQSDFGFTPLLAHQTRAALVHALRREGSAEVNGLSRKKSNPVTNTSVDEASPFNAPLIPVVVSEASQTLETSDVTTKRPLYKETIVNEHAKRRKEKKDQADYGLLGNYQESFPRLYSEMNEFLHFMTVPSTCSQETPIREATAVVYLRHAKLFLGWYIQTNLGSEQAKDLSIETIIPNKEKDSASIILNFLLFLRSERHVSSSYEANFLRGLTKLLKYRFRFDSNAEPGYGEKTFDDIPIIREVRKLHRDANKQQKVAPRSSIEEKKWLSWPEYLNVVQSLQSELNNLIDAYEGDLPIPDQETYTAAQRRIATAFQKYLILAIFACVPDRQRTIRELELGRTLIRTNSGYNIRHAPDDYKTGKTYGERPPLQLADTLTPSLDLFIKHWRSCLKKPGANHSQLLFRQVRTGNPLTADSVYQTVARACYTATGKRTNPHLLRDMIVTHIRESSSSEQELEALALFMGHSLAVQRSSYDRRTLKKKVAPAVELLQSVNGKLGNG